MVRESVPNWGVAEYMRLYPNTLDERRFVAMFSEGRNSTMFDFKVVHRSTNIGSWSRRWKSAGQRRIGIIDLAGHFNKTFVCHTDD